LLPHAARVEPGAKDDANVAGWCLASSCTQAKTKLEIPAARAGTARNINTVTKLADMAATI